MNAFITSEFVQRSGSGESVIIQPCFRKTYHTNVEFKLDIKSLEFPKFLLKLLIFRCKIGNSFCSVFILKLENSTEEI